MNYENFGYMMLNGEYIFGYNIGNRVYSKSINICQSKNNLRKIKIIKVYQQKNLKKNLR